MTDSSRTFWGLVWVERLWQDVQYGCRTLAASPAFTIVAVLSLAIGIGANCAIFSFADALLLRPLPVARPGEVLTVGSTSAIEAFGSARWSARIATTSTSAIAASRFEGLAAFDVHHGRIRRRSERTRPS